MKRTLDIAVATIGLVLITPLWLLIAVAIKLSSPGPVIFRQTRIGRLGRPFRILKFRTMRADAGGPSLTIGDDNRITYVGRIIRKLKLDELPQLVNVLRGEMSLVGPRPEMPEYVALYSPNDQRVILSVRPGITGAGSLAYRNETEELANYEDPVRAYTDVFLPKKLAIERHYIEMWSLWLDIKLLSRTLAVVLRRS